MTLRLEDQAARCCHWPLVERVIASPRVHATRGSRTGSARQSRWDTPCPDRDCFVATLLTRKRNTISPQCVGDTPPFSYRAGRPQAGGKLAMTARFLIASAAKKSRSASKLFV